MLALMAAPKWDFIAFNLAHMELHLFHLAQIYEPSKELISCKGSTCMEINIHPVTIGEVTATT